MKVVVETLEGQIVSDYCFKGWLGAENAGYETILHDLSGVSLMQDWYKEHRPMPIGSVTYMEYFFDLYDIEKPDPLQPNENDTYLYVDKKKDLKYPTFVKPLKDVKKFTGFVAKSAAAWDLYPELKEWDGPYLCSEPFKYPILSEWRYFIHKNKIVNVSSYNSEIPNKFPSNSGVLTLVDSLKDQGVEIAYTIDVAVLANGNTEFVELNDMWAIGPYGCDEDLYFEMLKDRWNQIILNNK